jgi:AcrR family transcriptional regulator
MNMVIRTEDLLDTAAGVLVRRPDATLRSIAQAAGVSRTTIFNRFPTRDALLAALAVDTLERMRDGMARLDWSPERAPAEVVEDLWRVVHPLSERAAFLRMGPMHESPDVTAGWAEAFTPWGVYVATLQAMGRVRDDMPMRWLAGSLIGLVFAAFDEVDAGEQGAVQAGRLVAASWVALAGAQHRSTTEAH